VGTRRRGRELALQILYQIDITGQELNGALAIFWENFESQPGAIQPGAKDFAVELVEGVWRERERIDKLIANSAEHWRLGRIARVDINVLRVATYEVLCCPDIPASVVINEAVEIARRYGTEDSPPFVNGILDHIATVLDKKEKDGAQI
jgi:N utilization substance protein B